MFHLLAAGVLAAVGLDAYVTHRRIEKYGPMVEINPLIRLVAEDAGTKAAIVSLVVLNVGLLSGIYLIGSTTLMAIFFGLKMGLVTCQLNSLRVETFIDRLFSAKFKRPST